MARESIEDIDEQIGLVKQRFSQVVDQIRTVLHDDVSQFVVREARRAFLASPEAAERLSDTQVAELKKRAQETGADAAARLRDDLADESLWTGGVAHEGNPRELTGVEPLWIRIRAVENQVADLLEEYDLGAEKPEYRPPVFFVSGLFLPSLAEHYWNLLEELHSLEQRKQSIRTESVRERLASRWEEA